MKFPRVFPSIVASLSLLLFVSCGPVVPAVIEPAALTETPSPAPTTTPCPPEAWPCPGDSLTLTAVMAETFAAIPSNTPPPWATIFPSAGDLGWGAVQGRIVDGSTSLPIEGATVTCEHFSYTSPYLCNGTTTTTANGIYGFGPVFFHGMDRITLLVEAPGYTSLRFEQIISALADTHLDLGLFPSAGETPPPTPSARISETPYPPPTPTKTPTPFLMCTPPPCPGGNFACGNPNGCPGGCGTICLTATPKQ